MAPHTMTPEVGPVCRGRMHSARWRSPNLRCTRVRPSLTYRQNLLSSLKTTERHSTLLSTLSRHQNSRAWRNRGVCGSLARDTSELSTAASRWFPIVLGDTAGAIYSRISSLSAVLTVTAVHTMRRSLRVSVLRGRPEHGLLVWECSTDHYWKQLHTTDKLCPTRAEIHPYFHPTSHTPTLRPRSNGRIATTGAKCFGQSIAGWHSAPLWQFACENTCLHWHQRGYTVY